MSHVGQVRPGGTLSTPRNRRGKRPISLALSCSPRSTIILRVCSLARICARLNAGGAEHAHGMIVRQQNVFDRLVGHLGDARYDVLGHQRCRLRVDDHAAVVADDHAGVRVAFGGVGEQAIAEAR